MLDSSNKGNECASAHPLGENVIESAASAIHADLDLGSLQQLAILWTGKVAALIAIADQRHCLPQCLLDCAEHKGQLQGLIEFPTDHIPGVPIQDRHQIHPACMQANVRDIDPPNMIGVRARDVARVAYGYTPSFRLR
jgi:hypothetical protein